MSDFDGRPFVAGSLTGLRAFSVDQLGRLIGPHRATVFTPGENVATCRTNRTFLKLQCEMENQMRLVSGFMLTPGPLAEAPPEEGHRPGARNCTCGFYAYFDGSNTSHETGVVGVAPTVQAVVEGYGVCSVGDRGFRAEKARLVALVIPDDEGGRARWDRWSDWQYRSEWWNSALVVLSSACGAWIALVGVGLLATGVALAGAGLVLLGLLLFALSATASRGWTHGLHRKYAEQHPELKCGAPRLPERVDLVRRNYPDVPVYPTVKAALAAHPLTKPEPPSPDEPDFWTRGAQ